MRDSYVHLPRSVETLLQHICSEKSLPPPDATSRSRLAVLDEASSLGILEQIRSAREIRNLRGFILYLANNVSASPRPPAHYRNDIGFSSPQHSDAHSPSTSTSTSPVVSSTRFPFPESYECSSTRRLEIYNHVGRQKISPQLIALSELEFRKAFVILSYTRKNMLEDVISADTILTWKHLPMIRFEAEVWNTIGVKYVCPKDRPRSLDWDSGLSYCYHCHVYPDGSYIFKGPYLTKQRTHLQRVLGDDNVLNVKFSEEEERQNDFLVGSPSSKNIYDWVEKKGILVGLRYYRFFVFKDGGKEEKKKNPTSSPVRCFFVRMESVVTSDENDTYVLSKKTIHEARSLFMHVHMTPSLDKYMARFSLILSKTMKLDELADVIVEKIDDVRCLDDNGFVVHNNDGEPRIHTDGTGFISEDLALKCPLHVFKGACLRNENNKGNFSEVRFSESDIREPPLLIQFRMFYNGLAAKGTLLINRKLERRTIQIRRSMIKVEADSKLSIQTVNSLEIVGTSNKPKRSNLSKYLVALLSYGGVPRDYFMSVLMNALEETRNIYTNMRVALKACIQSGEFDDFTLAKMILSGIPLDEPFVQLRLSVLSNNARKVFKEGKLPLSDCFHLMGTVDPTGTLKKNEVCIILENGQVSGRVLVFRHPGLHFGDIHVLNATYVESLEDIVGNAKYAIFFPTEGPRSLADEMAGGDFDGDMYWISRNPQLLDYFTAGEPWTEASYATKNVSKKKPCDFPDEQREHELFELFLTARFQPSSAIGVAADSWLTFMDRLLTLGDDCAEEKECLRRKMLQLVSVPRDLMAEKLPHFLGRGNTYKSTSILGQIYDEVERFERDMTTSKDSGDIWMLPCLDVEVPTRYLDMWKKNYSQYRCDMVEALKHDEVIKNELADQVIEKYKQLLYGAAEFEVRTRSTEEVMNESIAIYKICYKHAETQKSVMRCQFAWRVAGSVLGKLYAMKQEGRYLRCLASVLKEVLTYKQLVGVVLACHLYIIAPCHLWIYCHLYIIVCCLVTLLP